MVSSTAALVLFIVESASKKAESLLPAIATEWSKPCCEFSSELPWKARF